MGWETTFCREIFRRFRSAREVSLRPFHLHIIVIIMSSKYEDTSSSSSSPPSNMFVTPLLTDFYEIMMAYSYFKCGTQNSHAVFEIFFRQNPFRGEYTIFAGLQEALKYVNSFKLTSKHIDYIRSIVPKHIEPEFFEYLASLDCSRVKIRAMLEGSICFPREPIMVVEGPLGICQLLETTLLNMLNFPSLVVTNACRFRMVCFIYAFHRGKTI